jgi:hypothetical protein
MIQSPLLEVTELEKQLVRAPFDGDLDIAYIDRLIKRIVSKPERLTPDIAFRAHEAIEGLHTLFQSQMDTLRRSLTTLNDGRRALRGYTAIAKKTEHHRVYRNI